MSYKPILFNTDMVRAILENRKTMTRRVVKGLDGLNIYRAEPSETSYEDLSEWDFFYGVRKGRIVFDMIESVKAPYALDDVLWTRETWCQCATFDSALCGYNMYGYRADYGDEKVNWKWKPSIFMPKAAARIFLRVTNVQVDRIQSIYMDDIQSEGVVPDGVVGGTVHQWRNDYWIPLWNSINAKRGYGWDKNPWVWVYTFERVDKPEGWCK